MAYDKAQIRRYGAIFIIALLVIFLTIALSRFISVLFGALIIVTIFGPFNRYLKAQGLSRNLSAITVCVVSTIIIAIPLAIISGLLVSEASQIIQQGPAIIEQISELDARFPQFNIIDSLDQTLRRATSSLQNIIVGTVTQVTQTAINLIVFYFLVYFMLAYDREALKNLKQFIPFNRKNTETLVQAFNRITRTTVLGAGLVALIQGAILGIGLFLIGIPNPVILGFIGAVLSFLPVVGVALIWGPIGVIELINGSVWGVVGVLITGGLILLVDYTVRPRFQQKKGNIHPLISILGVLIGIQYFGIFGIVVGPLLLSYALLTIEMFMQEYVKQ